MSDETTTVETPTPSNADLARVLPPLETETRALYDGERRETHPDAHRAAKELTRRRREEQTETSEAPKIDEVHYTDGRDHDAEVSAKDAARDINAYRAQKAAALLEEMTGEQPAAETAPQPEQQAEPTGEQQQQQPSEQEKVAEQVRATEAARQTYEVALSAFIANAIGENLKEFADITTAHDVQRVAVQDPARFAQWRAHQDKLMAVQQELGRFQSTQRQEAAKQFENFAQRQDELAEEMIPELKPGARGAREFQEASIEALREAGFGDAELEAAWNGDSSISLRDARAQRVIADAARWRMAQARAKNMTARPTPTVLRPGVAVERNRMDDLRPMYERLSASGNLRDAARLVAARRAATRG